MQRELESCARRVPIPAGRASPGGAVDGRAFRTCAALISGLLMASLILSTRGAPVPPAGFEEAIERGALELDPARMGFRDFCLLPGIGEGRALAILEHRRSLARGPQEYDRQPVAAEAFPGGAKGATWGDVYGIGEATEERIRSWLAERGGDPLATFEGQRSAGPGP